MATKSVLVLNSGSSSIKCALFSVSKSITCLFQGSVEGIGTPNSSLTYKDLQIASDVKIQGANVSDHGSGLRKVMEVLPVHDQSKICAVGHRVVHGGEMLNKPSLITEKVLEAIKRATPLAPLHNPPNLEGIKVAQELFKCPHVAVFDTAFHSTMPPHAYMYAIPLRLYKEMGLRRYGFHGTSYEFLLHQSVGLLGKPRDEINVIAFHLGAGASMAAIKEGKCIDTTMGVTPLEGLVMATRSGDVDPGIAQFLASQEGLSVGQVDRILNKESGLYGLCGEKDLRVILEAASSGSEKHKLALDVFVHRIRKYLGAYLLHLEGKVDALIFTGGIGERSPVIRSMVCKGLENFGIRLNEEKNFGDKKGAKEIGKNESRIKIFVIPTDEELCIAQQTLTLLCNDIADDDL